MNLGQAKNLLNNPNFVKWFGKSQVKNNIGEPLQVYHATDSSFDVFDKGMVGKNFGKEVGYKKGFFFSDGTDVVDFRQFDIPINGNPQSIPAYLSLQKPLMVNIKNGQKIKGHWATFDDPSVYYDNNTKAINKQATKGKHDGIIVKNTDTGESMYVAFEPTQIKSPFNKGTFDPTNPNILKGATAIAAGSTLLPKDALAKKYKQMESDQALQDAYSPVDMVIAGATGGATMGLRAISALADPVINYAIDRMLGD